MKEFGINDVSKYKRFVVNMDKTGGADLSFDKEHKNVQETLFLKVLIEGKGSLFFYEGGYFERFFFTVEDSEIEQLVYKPEFD